MRTLTICQPYAELIVIGRKLVENRRWRCDWRGPLLIHAGKSREWMGEYQNWDETKHPLDFGAVVGVADLVACLEYEAINEGSCPERFVGLREHVHTEGPWCWVLENARKFKRPIPWRGQQGLFDVPDWVLTAGFR